MKLLFLIAVSTMMVSAAALAGPGDVHRVNADLVNLRAAPSDAATIRDRVTGGTEVLELRRDGGWYGVRVIETGQEGWIYGRLLTQTTSSALADDREDNGFGALSTGFDGLIGGIEEVVGVDMVAEVAQSGSDLTVTPTADWLRASSEEARILAAAAVYQMWKTHQNNAPVRVVLLDAQGRDYVVIEDRGEAGPVVFVNREASGQEGQG